MLCDICKHDKVVRDARYLYPYRLSTIKLVKCQGIFLCNEHAEQHDKGNLPASPLMAHYWQHHGIGRFTLPTA